MLRFRIVLVGPKYDGNVGSVARAMKNFGMDELILVNPAPLGPEAQWRAVHAWDVVERARTVTTFDEAIQGCDFVVATSARIAASDKANLRSPISVRDLVSKLTPVSGTVALCFGREDFGLFNDELEKCDLLVSIPTDASYPSLNLSHAVAVVLYELYPLAPRDPGKVVTPMSEEMRVVFQRTMDLLIDTLNLPEHKNRNTKMVYRRLFGRAVPSAWEYFVFMGILSGVLRGRGVEVEQGRFEGDVELPPGVADSLDRLLDESPKA